MADFSSGDPNSGSVHGMPTPGNPGLNGTNPAGPAATAGHGHGSSMHGLENSSDGLLHILRRQWHIVLLCTLATVMAAVLYLLLAHPIYTSVSTLRVKPLDPQAIASSASETPSQEDSDFLDTECRVIKSNAVLALAMDKIRDTHTLRDMPHPMEYVKAMINADLAKKGQAIDVSFKSKYPEDAVLIVDSVVQAYRDYESNSWKSRADDVLDTLKSGSKNVEDELVAKKMKLREIEKTAGFIFDVDPSKNPLHQEVQSRQDAKEKAYLEKMQAENAYEQAARAIIADPVKLKAVDVEEQKTRYSADPAALLKKYQDELGLEQAKLVDDSRLYGPNHPTIVTEQARVDELVVLTVVAAKEWKESAQSEYEATEKSVAEAQNAEVAASETQRNYIQLQLEVDHLKKAQEEVDSRINQIDLTKGAGALNISVLDTAEIVGEPEPTKTKNLAIALVLGIIAGLGLACVRDWSDDRMRSPQAIRAAAGASILGSVPNITTAYNAADRGQIVHHDPFGVAAESYRTLRTALQFGLPPGTKTMLVTSPVSGDGKSTFVSNLGIAMAQASKRVLIIDADLRAPMQHRLFGLKDRIGLSSVLAGGDTMAQAIQRTAIEGLDILPCGPTPMNPAELLNSTAFTDHLNELADKYDLVIMDSPPVTAVADARILAASADVSLLVVRLESSTRKQTEAARDGLRSVGGRLIGVAINGVSRSGSYGGASGYYPHGDLVTGVGRTPKQRAGFGNSEPRIDPAARV